MDNTISNDEEVIASDDNTNEETNFEDNQGSEAPTLEDYEKLKKENLTLKAQKEHFKKKLEKSGKSPQADTPSSDFISREEVVLIAQGIDIDDLDQLKAIQKGTGVKSLKEATENPLFKAYKKEKKEEKLRQEASLGASNGSGSQTTQSKPDMSTEEHKELWNKYYKK